MTDDTAPKFTGLSVKLKPAREVGIDNDDLYASTDSEGTVSFWVVSWGTPREQELDDRENGVGRPSKRISGTSSKH